MSLENRPYIGTWGMRDRTLVRYTPDCLVYINGYLHIPGCRACNGSIDFQKYITSVTVDPSINAVANATISLSIPQHASEAFTGDGNYLLRTGLFVTVYMRGYFPMKGVAGRGEESTTVANFDPSKVPVYPYYQVFRGVVTEVSHEYNGGVYSVSMSCSDFLHFWSNLKVATNGALFGPRPDNSNVQVYLKGHRFTGASPYSIIYSLFRIGFGSAGGVEFTMGRKTNIASRSDYSGESLSKMAGLNQERLFNSRNVNLRMYGVDGSLYNGFTQAYLGAFQAAEQQSVEKDALAAVSPSHDRAVFETTDSMKLNSRILGFNPLSALAAVSTAGDNPVAINVLQMHAFALDQQAQGQVNQFETDYMTKLEIANTVCEVTGFEFYQDVDGDIVFKPSFYNMDTRSDPVYVIKDRDLISLSEQDSEPEATYIKGTGSHFQNRVGTGLEGWLGVAAMYADYRLIADFGWREATFETNYLSDPRAIYISAINRLDVVNAGRRSANITIPLRPELKPGYPVYLEGSACFYYIESLNHSFQFGGQCTTQITGTAKRAKFHAPGLSGGPITVDNIQLDNPYLPACPLSSEGGEDGPPRYIGFPNVVLALDPDYVNPRHMLNIAAATSVEAIFQVALSYGVIEFVGEGGVPSAQYDGPFVLRTGNDLHSPSFTKANLETEWASVRETLNRGEVPTPDSTLGQIVAQVQQRQPDAQQSDLINYLVLMNDTKARVAPGMSLTGNYRYYSCSHPSTQHQGQKAMEQSAEGFVTGNIPSPTSPEQVKMFQEGTTSLTKQTPGGGITVTALDSEGQASQTVLQTSQIKFVTFAASRANQSVLMIKLDIAKNYAFNLQINDTGLTNTLKFSLISFAADGSPNDKAVTRFQERYFDLLKAIGDLADELKIEGVFEAVSTSSTWKKKYDEANDLNAVLTRKNRNPADHTVMGLYNSNDDLRSVKKAAAVMAKKLVTLSKDTFSIAIYRVTRNRAATGEALGISQSDLGFTGSGYDPSFQSMDPLYNARDKFLSTVASGNITFGYDGPNVTVKTSFENTTNVPVTTPVFPVSDAEGFEVYGSFAYGRGFTVNSYASLLQTAGPDGTVVAGTGNTTSLTTLQAMEEYLAALATGNGHTAALDAATDFVGGDELVRDDIERAIAAQGLSPTSSGFKSSIEERDGEGIAIQAHMSGAPVVSSDAEQSTLAANAPVELANIDPGTTEICQCKGAEAQFFLQAFSGEYASLDSNEAVQEFLENEAMGRAMGWEMGREAMAGQIRDTQYESLGEKFQKMGSDYADLFSTAGREWEEGVSTAWDDLSLADELAESAAEFEQLTEENPIDVTQTDITPDDE